MSHRTREQWLELFEAQATSGLSAAEFCRREGICPSYFSHRKRHFGWRRASEPQEPDPAASTGAGFVELRRPSSGAGLHLEWSNVRLSLPAGASTGWVAALMRELADASVQ